MKVDGTYACVLDRCAFCPHRGYLHAASQGVRMHCVAMDDGKACGCTKFRPAKEWA